MDLSKILLVLATACYIELVTGRIDGQSCPPNYYWSQSNGKCLKCKTCPIGFGEVVGCLETLDRVCESCGPGPEGPTFSRLIKRNGQHKCVSCRQCEHRETVRKCTANYNASCGKCFEGYYYDGLSQRCLPCSRCRADSVKVGECNTEHQPAEYQCLPGRKGLEINPDHREGQLRREQPGIRHSVDLQWNYQESNAEAKVEDQNKSDNEDKTSYYSESYYNADYAQLPQVDYNYNLSSPTANNDQIENSTGHDKLILKIALSVGITGLVFFLLLLGLGVLIIKKLIFNREKIVNRASALYSNVAQCTEEDELRTGSIYLFKNEQNSV